VNRPVLFVTNYAPPARVGAFARLAEMEPVEFALFGGRLRHGAAEPARLPFPHRHVSQREAGALAAGGAYGAVVCGTVGRLALPAAYAGARRARVPFVLWATLWAQPGGPAGLAGYPLMRWMYARADAVATYGPHVSAYVAARGARRVFEAPQAVDNAFWAAPVPAGQAQRRAPFQALFAGRLEEEKGVGVLLEAWSRSGLADQGAALVLAGEGPSSAAAAGRPGVHLAGRLEAEALRNFQAGSDVLVIPSVPTPTFREPWGLAANEAMCQGLPVIATDAVGAAAGGLVRHERSGLVVPAADPDALALALRRAREDVEARTRWGTAAATDVQAYTHEAWSRGMSRALTAARKAVADATNDGGRG
jgi:glycosyltransferase involved in cell wall biosynthesis